MSYISISIPIPFSIFLPRYWLIHYTQVLLSGLSMITKLELQTNKCIPKHTNKFVTQTGRFLILAPRRISNNSMSGF